MEAAEVPLRGEAPRRRLAGGSPRAVARDLGRTRQWVAKWAARYDRDDLAWARGQSRARRRVADRTADDVGVRVLAVRERLVDSPWARVGAPAMAWELEKLGAVVPPLRMIGRILARGRGRAPAAGPSRVDGHPVPAPTAKRPGGAVQVDLVGPRQLDGGVRLQALNQIDVACHQAGIEIVEDRADERVIDALPALWGRFGVPRRTQFDNGGPFVAPTAVAEVVRVLVFQGVTPVFVPPREPWRNGTIEHFNDSFE